MKTNATAAAPVQPDSPPTIDAPQSLLAKLMAEGLIPLNDLTTLPGGKRVSLNCMYRYANQRRPIHLETVVVARVRMSSRAAVQRYLERMNAARTIAPEPVSKSAIERRADAANHELEAAGV